MSAINRLEMIEKVIEKGSQDPFVWYARAMELRSLGRLEDALHAFDQVIERFATYVPTFLMAGQVARDLGQIDRARRYLEQGAGAAEASDDTHALGEIERELGMLRTIL